MFSDNTSNIHTGYMFTVLFRCPEMLFWRTSYSSYPIFKIIQMWEGPKKSYSLFVVFFVCVKLWHLCYTQCKLDCQEFGQRLGFVKLEAAPVASDRDEDQAAMVCLKNKQTNKNTSLSTPHPQNFWLSFSRFVVLSLIWSCLEWHHLKQLLAYAVVLTNTC